MRNVLIQAAIISENPVIRKEEIIAATDDMMPGSSDQDVYNLPIGGDFCLDDLLNKIRGHYFQRALNETNGVAKHAAALLGYKNSETFRKQLEKFRVK